MVGFDINQAHPKEINLEYFKKIFDELPACFQILSEDGYILEVNLLWLKSLGYSKENVLGKNFTEFVVSEYRENAIQCLEYLKKEGYVSELNLQLTNKSGDKLIFSFNGKYIYDEVDSNNKILCLMHDLTQTEEIRNKIKNIERFLYNSAIKFSELSYEDNIYDLIAKELKLICDNSYLAISSYDNEKDLFEIESLEGFGNLQSGLIQRLDLESYNVKYKIKDQNTIQNLKKGKLVKAEEDISKITGGAFSPSQNRLINKILNIGDIYFVGFAKNEILFGSAAILLKKGAKIDNIGTIETLIYQSSIALQKRETEKLLRESENNIKNIYESVNDAIFIHDFEGNIKEVNKKSCEMLSYTKEELLKKNIFELIPQSLIIWVKYHLDSLIGESSSIFEISLISKNDSLINVEFNSKMIKIKDNALILSVSRELLFKNKAEIELTQSQIKYNLEMGRLYIFGESNDDIAFNLFNSFLNSDYKGFIVSRLNKNKYVRKIKGDFEYFHITTDIYGPKLNPNYFDLIAFIESTPFRSIFILDSFYYLLLKNDLKDIFLFIDSLKSIGEFKKHFYFVFLNEDEVGKKIYKIVKNECFELEEKEIQKIPKDDKNVLLFVYNQNKEGIAPTLTEIVKYSKLSRPTISKKMKDMTHNNYVKYYKKGKSIHFELTKIGLNLLGY